MNKPPEKSDKNEKKQDAITICINPAMKTDVLNIGEYTFTGSTPLNVPAKDAEALLEQKHHGVQYVVRCK